MAIALCMEAVNFIIVVLSKLKSIDIALWNKIFCCGIVPIIVTTLIIIYGYYNMEHVIERQYTVYTNKTISAKGYKIALIADLHFGTSMKENQLQNWCNEIQSKNPDLVILCGDIVDENTTFSQMENAAKILGSIKSKYGTFYVYGNHDKDTYTNKPDFSVMQLKNALQSNKIKVLEDETYNINKEFTIVGRRDRSDTSVKSRKTIKELLNNINIKNRFILLLDHQPSEIQSNSKLGIDLQLSGHTHGGQIWPVGLFSGVLGFGQLTYGYEKIDNYQIIVTSGIGGWGYPIRTGSHSEYVIVNVKNK
ncbi:MAG: metallophosphoesterase [Clostridium sp.]|nr:metallophosphoesterase [Clostridium sp.]